MKTFKDNRMRKGSPRRNGIYGQPKFLRSIAKLRTFEDCPKGAAHRWAKLTETKVRLILKPPLMTRRMAKAFKRTFGISESYCWHLRKRKRWKHLKI